MQDPRSEVASRLAPLLATTVSAEPFSLFGQEVVVVSDMPAVADTLRLLFERVGSRTAPSGSAAIQVRVVGERRSGGPFVEAMTRRVHVADPSQLEHLAHIVIVNAAAAAAVDKVVLHAGAVERDGAAVVLIGPSGWGKTTLTIELVRRGWSFLTDDFAPIDLSGRALPFPRRVGVSDHTLGLLGLEPPPGAIRSAGAGGIEKWLVDVQAWLGARSGNEARLRTAFVMAAVRAPSSGGGPSWTRPDFLQSPEAYRLAPAPFIAAAVEHAVTVTGRRFFGGPTSDRERAARFLRIASAASGVTAFRLEPGGLGRTADLVERIASSE